MVYPTSVLSAFVVYLQEHYSEAPIDFLLRSYSHTLQLPVYVHVPSLVEHVGALSSLSEKNDGTTGAKVPHTAQAFVDKFDSDFGWSKARTSFLFTFAPNIVSVKE